MLNGLYSLIAISRITEVHLKIIELFLVIERVLKNNTKRNAYENIAVEGPNTNDEIIQEIDDLIEESQSSIKGCSSLHH
ncbi:10649_t:CDS:2 [Gigaspora margarita]|uniref:10649_t:CDS:1 n=1 Tax=Gigaspora margarita TaxID=4874 RepID=A0ABN7UYC0_GIGMA|nr:10649_t:CDS:2 [Gigaspora margarita]